MKRSFLFFALFAVVAVPFDLPRADAQDGFIEGPSAPIGLGSEFGMGMFRAAPGISADLRDRLRANIDILRDTSKTPDERVKARDSVKQLLTEMFDADVTRRREQLEGLQSQVEELKKQLDAQEKSRDELVELRLLLLDREISGKSAFPKEWDALSDMTGHSNDGAVRPSSPRRRGLDDFGAGAQTTPTITNSIGMKLVHIPLGELNIGSREVAVGHAEFFMGQTEVTQGQWRSVMETEPWKGQSFVVRGDDYPATFVSFEDAVLFCKKLSEREGRQYRLPYELEWEYACRAGSKAAFSFDDSREMLDAYAWYDGNTQNEPFAHQVGKKSPNAWSLYDMYGNVYEWTIAAFSETGFVPCLRGGSWRHSPADCRSANRHIRVDPSVRTFYLGFRVASVPSDPPVDVKALPPDEPEGVGTEVAPAEPQPESP